MRLRSWRQIVTWRAARQGTYPSTGRCGHGLVTAPRCPYRAIPLLSLLAKQVRGPDLGQRGSLQLY